MILNYIRLSSKKYSLIYLSRPFKHSSRKKKIFHQKETPIVFTIGVSKINIFLYYQPVFCSTFGLVLISVCGIGHKNLRSAVGMEAIDNAPV